MTSARPYAPVMTPARAASEGSSPALGMLRRAAQANTKSSGAMEALPYQPTRFPAFPGAKSWPNSTGMSCDTGTEISGIKCG